MPKNSRLKNRARAYAAAHGVSYIEAHRLLTQQPVVGWHYETYVSLTLDKSAHLNSEAVAYLVNGLGFTEEWHVATHTPLHLVEFRDTPITNPSDWDTIDDDGEYAGALGVGAWEKFGFAPALVRGKYPVFLSREWIGPEYGNKGGLFTGGRVLDVEAPDERLMPVPDSATMHIRASADESTTTRVHVGHLLWYLLNSDLNRLRDANWTASTVSSTVTGRDANLGLELLRWATIVDAWDPRSIANSQRAQHALDLLDGRDHSPTGSDYTIHIEPAHGEAWMASFKDKDAAGLLT